MAEVSVPSQACSFCLASLSFTLSLRSCPLGPPRFGVAPPPSVSALLLAWPGFFPYGLPFSPLCGLGRPLSSFGASSCPALFGLTSNQCRLSDLSLSARCLFIVGSVSYQCWFSRRVTVGSASDHCRFRDRSLSVPRRTMVGSLLILG